MTAFSLKYFIPINNVRTSCPLIMCMCVLLGAFFSTTVGSATPAQDEKKLERLKSEIKNLSEDVEGARQRKNDLQKELYSADKQISIIVANLKAIEQSINEKIENLNDLRWDEEQQEKKLEKSRLILARQLRASYVTGRQEYIKLLLNQDDIYLLGRVIAYYEYFGKARAAEIVNTRAILESIHNLRKIIWEKTGELEVLRQSQSDKIKSLEQEQESKKEVVAKLDTEISLKGSRIKQLQEDAEELEKFLERLRKLLADIPDNSESQIPIAKFKGQLAWPTKGGIREQFGQFRKQGKIKSNGVVISAKRGQSVRAVYHGRVVFSDWMRGYGMLLILDHGNGYMSLYGHNQSLFRNVGDWVGAGEEVAAVGDSGGSDDIGLYFEFRKDGKPVDPSQWCRR